MDVLTSTHNDADAPDDSTASDIMDASNKTNTLDIMDASDDMNIPSNMATPQTTAIPDLDEVSTPNNPATSDGEPDPPGILQHNFFDVQNQVFELLYDKITLFRTQVTPLVASVEA
jgi:hypothetical protein